ncbi:holo-ACP synthase [Daejeonella sp.]|uniref:holo-ACP synthase n=1 Tax=Daejeonella sp. TaxID=2805397 RepID=UPI003982E88A
MRNSINRTILNLELQNFAVGNDLVFIPDFLKSFTELFKGKVFTLKEIEYCERFDDPKLRYASTWAAKESVYKGIKQLYDRPLAFKNIEIKRSKIAGIPRVSLPEYYDNLEISLSITHDGEYTFAIAIVQRKYD